MRLLHPARPEGADARPLLVFLPGTDGTGQAILPQLPGLLRAGWDVRTLHIPPGNRSGWEQLQVAADTAARPPRPCRPPARLTLPGITRPTADAPAPPAAYARSQTRAQNLVRKPCPSNPPQTPLNLPPNPPPSNPPSNPAPQSQVVDLIEAALAPRPPELRRATLVAESFGGCLALRMALAAPRLFAALALLNPATSFNGSLGCASGAAFPMHVCHACCCTLPVVAGGGYRGGAGGGVRASLGQPAQGLQGVRPPGGRAGGQQAL